MSITLLHESDLLFINVHVGALIATRSQSLRKGRVFQLFFEVSSEEIEMEEEVMNEVDDIMDQMLEDNRNASVKAAARGGPELRKRKR